MISRRNIVDVDDEVFWSFIADRKSVQIGTIGKTGWPHMASLWFAIGVGVIILTSYSRTQKVDNLRRDNRVTLLWEDGGADEKLAGASVYGYAELIHGSDTATAIETVLQHHRHVFSHYARHGLSDEQIEQVGRETASKKTVIIVRPEKVITWDHTDLCGVY